MLAVVLVDGGICWCILSNRLTSGTLKLSEDILQSFSLRKISEAIGNGSYEYDYKTEPGSWDWMPDCDVYDISTEAYDDRVHGSVFIAVPRNPEDAVDEKVIVPLYADWMRHELFLTFEYLNDDWYLTSFTDGNSFTADLCGQSYFFNDYYGPSAEYRWHAGPRLLFEGFSVFELLSYADAYNNAMPDRFSLTEEE